jgi:tRNA pseudouridine55 synthase
VGEINGRRRPPRRALDGVLLLDKPLGMSSNGALQVARRLYDAAKGGHTGTLDPLATGLLPLCFGEATKFAGELLAADKTYHATIKLGITTDSGDAAGIVLETLPVEVTREQLNAALDAFRGDILQLPPMYSALKHEGQPLYKYARAGIDIARAPRPVTIHALHLTGFEGDLLSLTVDCSKGTYIRTLAHDLGAALGCGAHLVGLRRSRIGRLELEQSVTVAQLEALDTGARDRLLLPIDSLLEALPPAYLSDTDAVRMAHGQPVHWDGGSEQRQPNQRMRTYGGARFIGLCELSSDDWLTPVRLVSQSVAVTATEPEVIEEYAEKRV